LKIGRGWPKSAGTIPDGFWTSLQKHLTPFHKKSLVRSSILKKILASDSGAVISGQHGIRQRYCNSFLSLLVEVKQENIGRKTYNIKFGSTTLRNVNIRDAQGYNNRQTHPLDVRDDQDGANDGEHQTYRKGKSPIISPKRPMTSPTRSPIVSSNQNLDSMLAFIEDDRPNATYEFDDMWLHRIPTAREKTLANQDIEYAQSSTTTSTRMSEIILSDDSFSEGFT